MALGLGSSEVTGPGAHDYQVAELGFEPGTCSQIDARRHGVKPLRPGLCPHSSEGDEDTSLGIGNVFSELRRWNRDAKTRRPG